MRSFVNTVTDVARASCVVSDDLPPATPIYPGRNACDSRRQPQPAITPALGPAMGMNNDATLIFRSASPAHRADFNQTGLASWYGAHFHHRRTANGEQFDMNKLSAAHRTLPLNSQVRVTNLENGRSVVVRVNDRGPFVAGRMIDLSAEGARQLGFKEKGVARVRIQVVKAS